VNVVHYVDATYEDGAFGGVSRFDHELHKALPDLITRSVAERGAIHPGDKSWGDTLFITGNDMCLDIPDIYKCIVVHHGCAWIHQHREPNWRGHKYVEGQNTMKERFGNYYVSPSAFCSKFFEMRGIKSNYRVLHSSDLYTGQEVSRSRRVVGDWRNFNKGRNVIPLLKKAAPQWDFVQLQCGTDPESKIKAYYQGSIYLTLSLSEGCSYSQLDALALGLPVLSTDVSLFDGDADPRCGMSFSWQERDNVEYIVELLEEMYRGFKHFDPMGWMVSRNNFSSWKNRWRGLVDEVAKR
jgi:hypothetical protein